MPDHRDIAIETLADSEATLIDWIVDLIAERNAYRLVAQQAIHHCHVQHVELTHLRVRYERLINEYREMTARELEPV